MVDAQRIAFHDGVVLAVREFGPADGAPVLMLHGFPETGSTWVPLADRLGDRHIIAPDLRGQGLSDAPRRLGAYRLDRLVDDVVALIDHVGGRVDVVGHDWGGALVWRLVEQHPERVRTSVVLCAPHPFDLRRSILRDREQRRRSRYVLKAQLPWLPEWYLGRHDARVLASFFRQTMSDDEIDAYRLAWSRPGVIRGMVNWYRALFRRPIIDRARPSDHERMLVVSGSDDPLFATALIEASLRRVPRARHVVMDGVGHSPHRQAPTATGQLLVEHWGSTS